MKKYNLTLSFLLAIIAMLSIACAGDKQGTQKIADAIGDVDSLSPHNGNQSATCVVKATVNGQEMEFAYIDKLLNYDTLPYTETTDGKFTNFGFELGSDAKMKEKISIMLVNYNLSKETMPFTLQRGLQSGKQARLDMNIQKSNIFIPYTNQNDFDMQITKFTESEVEGTFAGNVKNQGNKIIKIENGSFKIRIKKMELRIQ